MTQDEKRIWLIKELQREMPRCAAHKIPEDADGQWLLLRSLFNVRPARPASREFLEIQDEFLTEMTKEKGITDCRALKPSLMGGRLCLWRGDITTLKADAIVNAANSELLGCWIPLHGCVDNIIHTMSGVELRIKCGEIMEAQGHEEESGKAKITPGYNLPAKYVIHTVGPIVSGPLRRRDCELLADCYRSSLELAAANGCESIAFCCISTGVFRFPADKAAETALRSVSDFLKTNDTIRWVVFNVFKESDLDIYDKLLNGR
ncbi:protein-ADP-ribose hydrolase [Synergistes jonesii]|uniref:protein-ADP-ribose hydrolase n=1 Tax=Synergistes jonesii TaxID=2754 RepID=UPI00331EADCA